MTKEQFYAAFEELRSIRDRLKDICQTLDVDFNPYGYLEKDELNVFENIFSDAVRMFESSFLEPHYSWGEPLIEAIEADSIEFHDEEFYDEEDDCLYEDTIDILPYSEYYHYFTTGKRCSVPNVRRGRAFN
jgi:hypothetical protein